MHAVPLSFTLSILALIGASAPALAQVDLTEVKGEVSVRAPKAGAFRAAKKGASLAEGTRVKTGANGEATLAFPGGTKAKVRPHSEIAVRIENDGGEGAGVAAFFGRVWAKVVKSSGDASFEVQSANAVAGVRGTEFEVGVADDGSTRVVVDEGTVGVSGDGSDDTVPVGGGYEIESSGEGSLAGKKKADGDPNWDGWFAAKARELEKRGLKVAKHLDGRLNRRMAKVKRLVAEQSSLRQDIERLEARKKRGEDVDDQLQAKLTKLERVTERLESMKARLQAAFGMFERWGAIARQGGMNGSDQLGRMADNISKIAADFADMIEEGTDQSEEGMHDMMREMEQGNDDLRGKSPADELF